MTVISVVHAENFKISPGCSLEGMMLKLKLKYFGHLMERVDSLEKTLMLGGVNIYFFFHEPVLTTLI